MKKKFGIVLSALALVVALIATLCACSTYGGIKKAFEKEGYEEIEISQTYKDAVAEYVGEEYADKVEIHVLQKKPLSIAIIVEFKADKDMVNSLKDTLGVTEEDVKEAYNKMQEIDYVSGTCVLIPIVSGPDAVQIFKGTK